MFYACLALATAVAETRFHRKQFFAATDELPQELDMRVYAVDLIAELHDILGDKVNRPALYDRKDYSASQRFASTLRDMGSDGIAYASVRHKGGECAAVFRPRLLTNCRQERHLCYFWNGNAVITIYEKKPFG